MNFAFAALVFAAYAFFISTSDMGFIDSVTRGIAMTWEVTVGTLQGLASLVTGAGDYAGSVVGGNVPDNRMMSPIGGAQIADGLLSDSPAKLWLLTAIFSTSLGLFNLLPLLPLDGGHAALVVAEGFWAKVRNRPAVRIDPNRFTPVAVVVLVSLVAVSVSAMYLDIVHPLSI